MKTSTQSASVVVALRAAVRQVRKLERELARVNRKLAKFETTPSKPKAKASKPVFTKPKAGASISARALYDAFDSVKDSKDWKNPINKVLDNPTPKYLNLIDRAVIHFTGDGITVTPLKGGKVRVNAPGYYATIGA